MTFASPIWLLGLLPWGGLALWLLWGLQRRTPVPFLTLWKTTDPAPPPRRRMQPPPAALICVIVAALAAILSAAGPRWGTAAASNANVLVLVDRGITMSNPHRFAQAMDALNAALDGHFDPAHIRYLNLPTQAQGDFTTARAWPATAINTHQLIQAAAARALREKDLILLVSDQSFPLNQPHLLQFAPADPMEDVAITQIGAAPNPAANPGGQVMVRLSNHSNRKTIDLTLASGGQTTTQSVPLPPTGRQKNIFINLPKLGPTIEARLHIQDSIPLDDAAYLSRQGANIKIEPLFQLPPELRRMAQVYQAQQLGANPTQTILIAPNLESLPPTTAAVVLPQTSTPAAGPIHTTDHPITAQVQWESWPWKLTPQSPPADWTPLIKIGPQTAVAITDQPARRIWVGLSSDEFTRSPQFVMFWTDIWDWLAKAQMHYTSQPVHPLTNDWNRATPADATIPPGLHPGVWQFADQQIALNADSFEYPPAAALPDATARLTAVLQSHRIDRLDLSVPLILIALILLTVAATLWPAARTAVSSPFPLSR